jgi:hypothetical protein
LHVPGALEWLMEPPVAEALARPADAGLSAPAVALLAATGQVSLSKLPDEWPPSMAARREELLAGNAAGESLSADDVLILAGEILRADRQGGVPEIQRLLARPIVDWRAPLAVAWGGIGAQRLLAQSIVSTASAAELAALIGALRATQTDLEAAQDLVDAADGRMDVLLLRLVEAGEVDFAAMVSAAGGPIEVASVDGDGTPIQNTASFGNTCSARGNADARNWRPWRMAWPQWLRPKATR